MRLPGVKGRAEIVSFVLIAVAVWLGWQTVREPAADRLPPELAIRLSPGSASVLARTAEAEFAADQFDDAEALARMSLGRAPFNVKALRVLGLAKAEKGQKVVADDMLTLAGNWSLRDDPSHAWLMDYRLSRGDYNSAFAHADTLARRRYDLQPQLFRLFTAAASEDPRALPVLASLLTAGPPWRAAYFRGLYQTEAGLGLAANLAIALQPTRLPFSNSELSSLYGHLLARHRLPAMVAVRARLERPNLRDHLINGNFAVPNEPTPFEWRLFNAGGLVAEVLPDDIRGDSALRAQYGSFSARPLAQQLIQLPPGTYRLTGETRAEAGIPEERLAWVVFCLETGAKISDPPTEETGERTSWHAMSIRISVPVTNCTAQWLRLTPALSDHRRTVIAWYDNFSIVRTR